MSGRGRAQMNTAVQGDLSNGRCVMNVDSERDTTEPTTEIGTASNFCCIYIVEMQTKFVLMNGI